MLQTWAGITFLRAKTVDYNLLGNMVVLGKEEIK